MSWKGRIGSLVAVALVGLVAGVLVLVIPATAATKRAAITGTLSRPGYTVIALAASGKPVAVLARGRVFSVRPPAAAVTLQLRAPNGLYAGPIVLANVQRGKQVIEGVRAGARLGKININVGKGYARVAKKPAAKWIDTSRWARAKKGVPLGNGRNDGFVLSKPPRHPPPGDLDADGVPGVLDVDINGNRIFNNVDTAGRSAHAAQAASETINSLLDLSTPIDGTVNADAGSTDAQIAAALPTFGWYAIDIAPGDSVELDCGGSPDPHSSTGWSGGLSWCAKGGTGTLFEPPNGPLNGEPFPACCDSNGDGYGTMVSTNPPNSPSGQVMALDPHATADRIGTGDTLIERVTTGGVEHQLVNTLQYSVATTPALVSYDDGQGDSATVSYPVSGPSSQPPGPGGPGTQENPFPVKADPSTGHVTVKVALWRPQRKPIPSDAKGVGGDACLNDSPPCQWIDIGGLDYADHIEHTGAFCPQSAFVSHGSNLDDVPIPFPGVKDLVTDQPANPANTLTYTLDLTTCAASPVYSEGRPAPPYSFEPGDTRELTFSYNAGSSAGNGTSGVAGDQTVFFKRVS